jgi:hypothetical protein
MALRISNVYHADDLVDDDPRIVLCSVDLFEQAQEQSSSNILKSGIITYQCVLLWETHKLNILLMKDQTLKENQSIRLSPVLIDLLNIPFDASKLSIGPVPDLDDLCADEQPCITFERHKCSWVDLVHLDYDFHLTRFLEFQIVRRFLLSFQRD